MISKKITIKDIKNNDKIIKNAKNGVNYTIKNKTKIDLSILDKKTLKKLYLIDKANNKRFIDMYKNYCNNYNKLSYNDLKSLDLFIKSNTTKTTGFWSLSFNSSLVCNNLYCSNFLRCYSKKTEKRFNKNVLKTIARQHVLFNKLSVEDLVLKFKPVLSGWAPVRLCQYGSVTKKEFLKLLNILDSCNSFIKPNMVYIYLDKPFKVPNNLKYLINNGYLVINSSNRFTYDYFKKDGLKTNLIISKEPETVEQYFKEDKAFKYCGGNCTVCNYCMNHQEQPILFKNH